VSPWTLTALSALGVFAGANLAFQAVLNTQLRAYLGTPLRASFVSYVGGLLCCLVALLVTRQSLNIWSPAIRTHWLLWTGGVYGVLYVTIAIWLFPRLGAGPIFGLVVAGQMLAALAFDQFGLFGIANRPIDPAKILGVALLVAGVFLVRR
jgi:transporter family-2 protein